MEEREATKEELVQITNIRNQMTQAPRKINVCVFIVECVLICACATAIILGMCCAI